MRTTGNHVVMRLLLMALVGYGAMPASAQKAESQPGASIELIQGLLTRFTSVHKQIEPQLAKLVPVKMSVSPELAMVGEEVMLDIEALADRRPNDQFELQMDYLGSGLSKPGRIRLLKLDWQAAGTRHGLTVYQTHLRLPIEKPGMYLGRWVCDIGGDVPEFWRPFAVIDNSYAVVTFNSTTHAPDLFDQLHRLHIPFERVETTSLALPDFIENPRADYWASVSRDYRRYGEDPTPFLFTDYYLKKSGESRFYHETEAVQRAVLAMYRDVWPFFGFKGPMDDFACYAFGNTAVKMARELNYRTISLLCASQNWKDNTFKINHSGMPERIYFMSKEDFRKPGDGGPKGLVGIIQCYRNGFLNHDYCCGFSLEPAFTVLGPTIVGSGRKTYDEIGVSRILDYFEAILQNRRSQKTPYFFSVGLEFNGVQAGVADANRILVDYAAAKAAGQPLVFATGDAVARFFQRRYTETPESTCYEQDYYCGVTMWDKPPSFPDTMEIEGARFKAMFKASELLPERYYDYQVKWDYPDWGNENLPRSPHGVLFPGTYDRFAEVPRILDTRGMKAERRDSTHGQELAIEVHIESAKAQANMALALWDIPHQWQAGEGWWSVAGKARFVPVVAPYTDNLNGILVADLEPGENRFTVTIKTPPRVLQATTIKIGDRIEGRVYKREGKAMAYLWPTKKTGATLVLNLPKEMKNFDWHEGLKAHAYLAPDGDDQPLFAGEYRFKLPWLNETSYFYSSYAVWVRLVGLEIGDIEKYARSEELAPAK